MIDLFQSFFYNIFGDYMNKSELRKYYLNLRNSLTNSDYKSKIIVEKILNEKEYKQSQTIGVYSSFKNEVNLNSLMDFSIENNKIVCLPIVLDDSNMVFCKINSREDLININKYKIKEPLLDKLNIINSKDIDLIIVPGICFDTNKNRIGFGKGYYDKYLKNSNSYNIGVCYDEQLLKDFYIENRPFDIALDEVITDKVKIK